MLRQHKKLTKKELKKDPFVIFMAQAVDFIREEWMKIGGTILTVVVVILAAFLIVNGKKKSEINAYDAAIIALANDAPEALELLERLIDNHGGSDKAADAMIKLGNQYFQTKDLDSAEKYYSMYLKKFSNNPILTLNASNGLGAIYEEKGEFVKAAEAYDAFVKANKNSVFLPMMHLNAGKAYYHSGDKDAAKRHFTVITANHNDSKEKQEAAFFLEMLN